MLVTCKACICSFHWKQFLQCCIEIKLWSWTTDDVTSCRNCLLVIGNWHNKNRINAFYFFYSNLNDVAQNTAVTSYIMHYQKITRNIIFYSYNYIMKNNKSRLNNTTRNVIPVFVGHLKNSHEAGIRCTSVYLWSTIEVRNLLMLHKQSSNSINFGVNHV